jgi:hypothetical protein
MDACVVPITAYSMAVWVDFLRSKRMAVPQTTRATWYEGFSLLCSATEAASFRKSPSNTHIGKRRDLCAPIHNPKQVGYHGGIRDKFPLVHIQEFRRVTGKQESWPIP